jgi:hypothetical protein
MIYVICSCFGFELKGQGLCGNDEPDFFNPDPFPNCSIPSASQCLKIKFHYLINPVPNGNIPSPEDSYFAKLLNELNLLYIGSNISFTTESECVERGVLQSPVSTIANFSEAIIDPNTNLPRSGSKYKDDFINIYCLSTTLLGSNNFTNNGYAYGVLNNPNKWAFVRLDGNEIKRDASLLAHEIGHLFSLRHTHERGSSISTHEVKSRSALDALGRGIRCRFTGDWLCDTGADPYGWSGFSIAPIEIDCNQNPAITASVPDAINDITTSWDIPVTNIMSYYFSCRKDFSPCQISAMLNEISKKYGSFLTNCGEDEMDPECLDIEINTAIVWQDGIKKLCPDQKISIGPNGHLTLNNFTLTKKENSNNLCPELSGNWDGIYLQSGSGGASMPGSTPSGQGSKLTVLNGSIIEFSDNGIQAPNSHSGININSSTMRKNGIVMDIRSSGLLAGDGINITNSILSNHSYGKDVMLRIIGSNLFMSGSSISNYNTKLDVTAIKAFMNRVRIINSCSIHSVAYGIDKERGSGFSHALVLENSRINGSKLAIRNRDSKVSARKNYINGKTDHLGRAMGHWYGNNFRDTVQIDDPRSNYEFKENLFYNKHLLLKNNQSLTDALCNQWANNGAVAVDVDADVYNIKSAWGSEFSSSGNVHDGNAPLMSSFTSDIANYHYEPIQNSIFTYGNKFTGRFARANNSACLYNQFPSLSGPGQGGTSIPIYDDSTNQNLWSSYHQQYQQAIGQMPHPDDSIQALLTISAEDALVRMGQCVLEACLNSEIGMSLISYQLWKQRTDPILLQMDSIIPYLIYQDFESLADYLVNINVHSDDYYDHDQMLQTVEWLISRSEEGLNMYNLNRQQLDSLVVFSRAYFGPYTSIIRGFLNAYYDIRIDPPLQLNQYTRKSNYPKRTSHSAISLIIQPNPSTECFRVYHPMETTGDGIITIKSLNGQNLYQANYHYGHECCISESLTPGIYLIELSSNKGDRPVRGKLAIH